MRAVGQREPMHCPISHVGEKDILLANSSCARNSNRPFTLACPKNDLPLWTGHLACPADRIRRNSSLRRTFVRAPEQGKRDAHSNRPERQLRYIQHLTAPDPAHVTPDRSSMCIHYLSLSSFSL